MGNLTFKCSICENENLTVYTVNGETTWCGCPKCGWQEGNLSEFFTFKNFGEKDWRLAKKEWRVDNPDMVNHPSHYTAHPSGVECIDIIEHFCLLIGNAIKYLWRAGLKGGPEKEIEDLEKAIFYIQRRIKNVRRDMEGSS